LRALTLSSCSPPPGHPPSPLIACCTRSAAWRAHSPFAILEIGFKTPSILLAAIDAFIHADEGPRHLDHVAIEAEPPTKQALTDALTQSGLQAHPVAAALLAHWPPTGKGLHRIRLPLPGGDADARRAWFTLAIGPAQAMLPQLAAAFDAFCLDAGPGAPLTPEAARALARPMASLARPGALLWASGQPASVLAEFTARGFTPRESGPDQPPAGSAALLISTRTQARKPVDRPATATAPRHAVVVGAGLAGCACAAVLADRGWRVTVLDSADGLEGAGGGQPVVADHPHFSPDDNLLARLSHHALRLAAPWRPARRPLGRLQLAITEVERVAQVTLCARAGIDPALARVVDAVEASALSGIALPWGGLWMPGCDAVDPAELCHRWLTGSAAIEWRPRTFVAALHRAHERWHLLDGAGETLACAPVVILANAHGAAGLARLDWPGLQRLRGHSSRLRSVDLHELRCILGGPAYACPLPGGQTLVGSGFDDGGAPDPEVNAVDRNLRRLKSMLRHAATDADISDWIAASSSGGIGWRLSTPDRLPIIGALPDEAQVRAHQQRLSANDRLPLPRQPGLYGHCALGARGLLWSTLGAEVLGAAIDGGASPLPADLLRAIDPSRFLRQRLRRGQPI
jgi:tRNA 5-methylaminomethyl-2-thiouridine biosynthesis bifunctional protein